MNINSNGFVWGCQSCPHASRTDADDDRHRVTENVRAQRLQNGMLQILTAEVTFVSSSYHSLCVERDERCRNLKISCLHHLPLSASLLLLPGSLKFLPYHIGLSWSQLLPLSYLSWFYQSVDVDRSRRRLDWISGYRKIPTFTLNDFVLSLM